MAGGLSEGELAIATDSTPQYIAELVAAGLIVPRQDGHHWSDVWRVRLLKVLDDGGIGPQQISTVMERAGFNLDFVERVFDEPSPRTGRSYAEYRKSLGERGELLGKAYRHFGLAEPPPEHSTTVAEEAVLLELIEIWQGDEDLIRRAARIAGQTVQRLTEGWLGLYYELFRRLRSRHGGEWTDELGSLDAELGPRHRELRGPMLEWLGERHLERRVAADLFASMEEAHTPFALERAEGRRVAAVAFVDLSGFTQMVDEHGDARGADSVKRFEESVERLTPQHGGQVVKLLGDGAMLRFGDAASAVLGASTIRAELAALHMNIHAGVAFGPLIERDNDLFGGTVNLASRLAGAAEEGQVLVSQSVVEAVDKPDQIPPGLRFEALGARAIRGLTGLIPVWEVSG